MTTTPTTHTDMTADMAMMIGLVRMVSPEPSSGALTSHPGGWLGRRNSTASIYRTIINHDTCGENPTGFNNFCTLRVIEKITMIEIKLRSKTRSVE